MMPRRCCEQASEAAVKNYEGRMANFFAADDEGNPSTMLGATFRGAAVDLGWLVFPDLEWLLRPDLEWPRAWDAPFIALAFGFDQHAPLGPGIFLVNILTKWLP